MRDKEPMNARDIRHTEAVPLSRKPPLGENRPRPQLVWENPKLSAGTHREKSKAKLSLVSGQTLYTYVMNNPISFLDPIGKEVQVCGQPAFGWMPVDHQWIKTDATEAGMGGANGNEPGNESGDMPGDPVVVTDHRGRSEQPGAKCETVKGVNEDKVNELLEIGRSLGTWGAFNNCQSFVTDVLRYSTPGGGGGGGGM